ncbi:hypothetical protein Tco_0313454 [Tanacetum coccineum]
MGNSKKKTKEIPKGNIMILPPVSVEETIVVQRETKARTILLQSLPEDHMADFHHLDDARDIWLAIKARFGGNDESKKMRKSMLKQEFSEFRVSESEGLHKANDSFDDMYNKLRTLEIDVKGGSSYDSRGTFAPTHSAFISAASTNSKMSYADSQNQSPSITFTTASSSADTSTMPIERFKRKHGRKNKVLNNMDACEVCQEEGQNLVNGSELGHLARTVQGSSLDSKPDHEGEDEEKGVAQVYGMIAGDDDDDVWWMLPGDGCLMLLAEICIYGFIFSGFGDTFGSDEVFDLSAPSIFDTSPMDVAEKPLYDWFVKTVGMHAVPPPITGTFMPPSNRPDLDDTQVTYGSKSNNHFETNSVSNDYVSCDNSDKSSDSETTGFASCVSSVKSSSSKTNEPLASAPSSVDFKTVSETADHQQSSTNDDSSFSFKENVKLPRNLCNKSGINSRSLCKRKSFGSKTCFVCGSKFHLIKDCDFYENKLELHNKPMWTNVANIPSFVPKAASVPAGRRNRPTSVPAGRAFPAGSRNRPASVFAGRPFSAGWRNNADRPMTRPTSHYFQHFRRPGCYNQLFMDEGRWGTAVKTSAGQSSSVMGGHGSLVWSDQQQWHIRSWRLFPFSNVHVLETISGKVVYMFVDGSYPLSVQLMKKMLKHKLEIEIDGVGNDMTYAEQLIQFIKNQIAASIPSA